MDNTPDYYSSLGVSKEASAEEIKKAYRKLSLQFHPDRNHNSDESTEKFKELNRAYEILSNEKERMLYDRRGNGFPMFSHGHGHGPAGHGFTHMEVNPEEIFNFLNKNIFEQMGAVNIGGMMFGTNGVNLGDTNIMSDLKSKMMKPMPIVMTEEITLSKAFSGCNIPIIIKRWVAENGVKREESETVYMPVPKGVDDNELIILRGKGNLLSPNTAGDVKIFIKLINDSVFTRSGLDLIFNKSITLKEALCGFSFDLNYIDGRTFKINNGTGNIINHNYSKVINSLGLTRDEHVGNLIINFTVEFPKELTSAQVEGLSKIL